MNGFTPYSGKVFIVNSLPNIRTDNSARRKWITPEQDAALTKLWEQMKKQHPHRYRDTDAKGNPLKLYYFEDKFDQRGNLIIEVGEMSPKDFYPLDWLETNGGKKSEYDLSPKEWSLLESIPQKRLTNPTAVLKTKDGRVHFVKMNGNTAIPGDIQCTGAALQPLPDTDPPIFDLEDNLRIGIQKKIGVTKENIMYTKLFGIASWKKSGNENAPIHGAVIFEVLTNLTSKQLQDRLAKHNKKSIKPQVAEIVSFNPRNREAARVFFKMLPDSGQRAYLKPLVKALVLEYARESPLSKAAKRISKAARALSKPRFSEIKGIKVNVGMKELSNHFWIVLYLNKVSHCKTGLPKPFLEVLFYIE